MKSILFISILFLGLEAWADISGQASCHYELYTPKSFERPVITKPFELDLSKLQRVSTDHELLSRTLRLRYLPATLDGKTLTHFSFAMTYDGAHSGVMVPATDGQHIVQIGKSGSDLIGAYLFCDVKLNKATASTEPAPDYKKIVCHNSNDVQDNQSLIYTRIEKGLYKTELVKLNETKLLRNSHLYLFRNKVVNMNNGFCATEFDKSQDGGATNARVTMISPYYESYNWLCKGYGN